MTWSGTPLPGNRWDLLDGRTPDPLPTVSVITAHYRQPTQLALTLAALAGQDYPGSLVEVIVADDGSPEPPTVPPGIRVVRQDDHGFRAAAVRNLGAAAATGDILVFLDADTVPEPGYVRALTRLPALAPDCVTVGRRRHADLSGVSPGADIADEAVARELPEPTWLRDAYDSSRDLLDADDRSYRFVIGAVMACSRVMFEETGGFDESFTSYGGEDWEWAYRCWVHGAVLAHVPDAVAWHDGPDVTGRGPGDSAPKVAEAMRLADLIPVPGSRTRGLRPEKVDVAIAAPVDIRSSGQWFVAADALAAALPGAEVLSSPEPGRFDRVGVRVDMIRPFTAPASAIASAVDRVRSAALGRLDILDVDGAEVARIVSTRAETRSRRWQRDDLFPVERLQLDCAVPVVPGVDVEAYLGGWL